MYDVHRCMYSHLNMCTCNLYIFIKDNCLVNAYIIRNITQ